MLDKRVNYIQLAAVYALHTGSWQVQLLSVLSCLLCVSEQCLNPPAPTPALASAPWGVVFVCYQQCLQGPLQVFDGSSPDQFGKLQRCSHVHFATLG